jgi:endonuclease YncB( thermonuclease family)
MGWIVIPIVFVAALFLLFCYAAALNFIWKGNRKEARKLWNAVWFIGTITTIILMAYTGFREEGEMFSAFLMMWLLVSIMMITSIIFAVIHRLVKKEPSHLIKPIAITFGVGAILFVLQMVTVPDVTETEDTENLTAASETEKAVQEESVDDEEEKQKVEEEEKQKAEEEAKQKEEEEKQKAEEEAKQKEEEEKQKAEEEAKQKEEEEKQKAEEEAKQKEEEEKQKAEEAKQKEEEKSSAKDGLVPVTLYRVVDGDTVNVYDEDGNELKLRLLLIDTPETVHPQKTVEPYGKEASARMTELVNSADQLYIEYDEGEKTDHYDRHLVYLYADDVNVHEVLLEEGLARVGYIYEQKKYLSEFKEAEQRAKDKNLGIWSMPGYVNTGGEGFNSEDEESTEENNDTSQPASNENSADTSDENYNFQNCTELNEVFPDGVASDHPAYQPKMDRDKDDWACE